jgi:hypothetical protein
MGNFQNFPIMTNVTDVAVTGQNNYFGFYLYFTFIKNNLIAYKKVSITFENNQFQLDTIDRKWDVSKGDGSGSVHAPDISLRNGKPVIAWQGSMYRTMTIVYEQGNDETMTYTNYPIVASYKYTTNTGENWSGFIKYPSSVNHTQQNANVEGCKNKLSFLINYSIDNSIFKQDVQFQNPSYSNYHCCPNYFSGTDAKLVKGSYFDDFGQNSNPMILTLSQQSPSQYLLSQQPFSITNLPCNYSNVDNYTNLGGIVNDSGINYYFNLGPIIVKNNYISGYDANGPIEITVLNSIDFNKNMISKPFLLSEGDTLILGGTGNYSPNPNEHFFLKKFNVSLFRQSNGQLQQLLFSDTLLYKDSVETEYLRGFFMSNFGSPDSFYVQMSIDSSDVSQGTAYKYSCAYSPDEIEGDNSGHYKSKIHFQNQNNNNISNIPKTFELQQNYPNPFNPSTTIKYNLPKDAYVTMKIYDIVGREIYTLVNENKQAGYYSVNFNGSNLASGIYFYRIKAGDFISVKKMLLIK